MPAARNRRAVSGKQTTCLQPFPWPEMSLATGPGFSIGTGTDS